MRTVVITGASSGIGKELCSLFEQGDFEVIKIARSLNNPENDEYSCDVSNFEQVLETFKRISEKHPHIDILINNAGFGLFGASEFLQIDDCHKQFDVNFFGVLNCTKCALPLMTSTGKIINISSACALFSLPFRSLYCASKAAVNSLSYGMRNELKNAGIDVVAVCPGDIKTEFVKNRVKYFETNLRYGNQVERAADFVDNKNDKRMDKTKVAEKIYQISTKKKCKAMYIIGFKYKLLNFLSHIVPVNVLYWGIHKIFLK